MLREVVHARDLEVDLAAVRDFGEARAHGQQIAPLEVRRHAHELLAHVVYPPFVDAKAVRLLGLV